MLPSFGHPAHARGLTPTPPPLSSHDWDPWSTDDGAAMPTTFGMLPVAAPPAPTGDRAPPTPPQGAVRSRDAADDETGGPPTRRPRQAPTNEQARGRAPPDGTVIIIMGGTPTQIATRLDTIAEWIREQGEDPNAPLEARLNL